MRILFPDESFIEWLSIQIFAIMLHPLLSSRHYFFLRKRRYPAVPAINTAIATSGHIFGVGAEQHDEQDGQDGQVGQDGQEGQGTEGEGVGLSETKMLISRLS